MANVLIVEDNEQKFRSIEVRIVKDLGINVVWARTVRHAYNLIEGRTWGALVLDMTFEDAEGAFRSTSKKPLAGIEVLQFIDGADLDLPTIVVTQHDKFPVKGSLSFLDLEGLDRLLSNSFPKNYRGVVRSKIGTSDNTWLRELLECLRGILVE